MYIKQRPCYLMLFVFEALLISFELTAWSENYTLIYLGSFSKKNFFKKWLLYNNNIKPTA